MREKKRSCDVGKVRRRKYKGSRVVFAENRKSPRRRKSKISCSSSALLEICIYCGSGVGQKIDVRKLMWREPGVEKLMCIGSHGRSTSPQLLKCRGQGRKSSVSRQRQENSIRRINAKSKKLICRGVKPAHLAPERPPCLFLEGIGPWKASQAREGRS